MDLPDPACPCISCLTWYAGTSNGIEYMPAYFQVPGQTHFRVSAMKLASSVIHSCDSGRIAEVEEKKEDLLSLG